MIINADDFGLTEGINKAVVRAHTEGVLTSATLMAGAQAAEHAVDIARQYPTLGVGAHLNVLLGKPVSDDPAVTILLDQNGEFPRSAAHLALKTIINKNILKAIEIEFAAQIEWILDHKITPTHLDSHKHLHALPTILPLVDRLADRFNISAVRFLREPAWLGRCKKPSPPPGGRTRATVIRTMAKFAKPKNHHLLKNQYLFGIAHAGKIDGEFWEMVTRQAPAGVTEVMTHPGYPQGLDELNIRLVDQRIVELEALCSDQTKRLLKDAEIELIHY